MVLKKLLTTCGVMMLVVLPGFLRAGEMSAEARQIVETLGLSEFPSPISAHDRWAPSKIVVTAPPYFTSAIPGYLDQLRAAAPGVELVIDDSGERVPAAELLEGADALIGFCSQPAMERTGDRFL